MGITETMAPAQPDGATRDPEADVWTIRPAQRRRARFALLVLMVAVATVSTQRWWTGWRAHLEAPGIGVAFADDSPTRGVVHSETAFSSQETALYDESRQVQLSVALSSDRSVHITRVEVPLAPTSLIKLVGTEISPMDAPAPTWEPFRSFDPKRTAGTWVRFTFRFSDCASFSAGSTVIYDHVAVTYEALGRTRHQDIPLASLFGVRSPSDATCPRT